MLKVPDDLMIDARDQRIRLTSRSANRTVEIRNEGRVGPFANGPIPWTRFLRQYIEPALWQFETPSDGVRPL